MPSQVADTHRPPLLLPALGAGVGAVGVGDQPQMGHRLAQPRRIQPSGGL
jgi:hypothetical protein